MENFLETTADNYLFRVGDSLTFYFQGKNSVYLLRQNLILHSNKLTDMENFLETTADNYLFRVGDSLTFYLQDKNSVYLLPKLARCPHLEHSIVNLFTSYIWNLLYV
ncbi:MAG: hypothetical protein F6K25_24245 [Okeania sp. SIO2G4]|nr:hypothetical protein [Okeania sp. SIO2G4]NEQ93601.1 hypothetical protein [Okeania sp. SIO2G4]